MVDATITGNAQSLKATGTVKGSNIGYGDNSALSANSTFNVEVAGLVLEDAKVSAKTAATFVTVGGQEINELAANTTYAADTLEFDATAQQGVRELQARGRMVILPEHQEIYITNIGLRSEMIQWMSAAGSEARIQYGADRIVVNNLRLVSGDQQIAADGVIGSNSESLRVEARNVDVAQIDALLLGDQRMAGRFTGTASVSGPTSAPRVAANFTLAPGAFRQFTFESLAGTVDYAGTGLALDVRLQQTPQAWATAKGFASLSLFRATPAEEAAHAGIAAGEAVNLEIATSQVDLGIIQGFTSYVTNVTGTLQANVKVTGSGADPHASGAVEIRGGAFQVPELGTAYTGLDTRIDLKDDQVSITQMRILDKNGMPMTIGGTLCVHERSVGAVNIAVQSTEFEVIDNDLGHLELDTDLKLTGEVRAPRLEGSVDVHTGTIDVARLLMQTTSSAYSTTATEITPANSGNGAPVVEAPSLFERLDLRVALAIPGNLVVNGRDLRPANAPIEVGDLTTTLGGALQIEKLPYDVLRVYGEVNTVRGTYTFQGRRFDIERDGRVRFWCGNEIEAYLNLRASRTIAGVQTFVRITGTLSEPELAFSSNPPLEEADILSLIIFNQPVNELGEGQQVSLVQRAGELAGGYLASGLATSIGNALRLDEFQIQAAGDQGGGPQLTVGEQVGNNLFFRLRQGFGADQATELILEYQIREFLRLQATAAEVQGGTQRVRFRRIERGGIDLIFFFNY